MPNKNASTPAPARRVYSKQRFRIVVTLLALVTTTLVVATSTLIFYYLRFSVLVDQRLKGERAQVPSRLYSRPLELRPGLPMDALVFVKLLNALRYDQQTAGPPRPGEFLAAERSVTFTPRPGVDAAGEPITVAFEKPKGPELERIKELRGAQSKQVYKTLALEAELITYLFDESREKRRLVKLADIPKHVVEAVLAIEDRRFYAHPGLDPIRILGAALRNFQADSYIQGGSTITQQLVKNFFLTPERTFKRKAQEALIALVLERRASKDQILELYLNEIYLGQVGSFSINGVGEAARMYFNKDVGNLTLPEGAMIAGMIQSPNPYNPARHPQRAKERRNTVLRAMQEAGFIEKATLEAAALQPLPESTGAADQSEAPYFVDLVKTQLAQRYDAQVLTKGNLSIYTSLDVHLQLLAQDALQRGLARVDGMVKKRKDGVPVQGCLIALEPATGAILALVGGRSYGSSQYNRVIQAHRQPGSTFKPFVYLTAFETFYEDPALPPITPATVVEDAPAVFFFEDKEYTPQNYEDTYLGHVTLRKALANSLNVATVKVAELVGYDRVAAMWTTKLGLGANIRGYPAVALGSFEATPLEMATAYNVLANQGLKVAPVTVMRVVDAQGQTREQHDPAPPVQVVHQQAAFLVINMLRSVLSEGTGAASRALGFTLDAAGKTGTTNDMRDAWFSGFTPDLLCVIWVGYDDNQPLNLPGSRAALPIWVDFMKAATAGREPKRFPVPEDGVVFAEIDKQTGFIANPGCPKVITEAFIVGTEPVERCPLH